MLAFCRLAAHVLSVLCLSVALFAGPATAQEADRVWIQIEAQPDEPTALDRARAYAALFPDVAGYRLQSGWHAIVLGPYGVGEGAGRLNSLLNDGLVPGDSYIVDGSAFDSAFWPDGASLPAAATGDLADPEAADAGLDPAADPAADTPVEPAAPPEPITIVQVPGPDETRAEARASEGDLLPEDREELQTALQWFGVYPGGIDGAFGPGTRNAMAAWQDSMGLDATGVLTTRQRAALLANYRRELGAFGFRLIDEPEAGIAIELPMALLDFDHYEPPFVHFRAKDGSALQVILISEPGDTQALYGLYDLLQTLTVVPLEGERARGERSFRIEGRNARVDSTTFAETSGGLIKGFMLVTAPGDARRARILQRMEASFRASSDRALDPGMVALEQGAQSGLLAGLEVRRPRLSRSGVFVAASGHVVTAASAVESCGRITLERDKDATLVATDAASGLALLAPATPVAPPVVAAAGPAAPAAGARIAVSGYPYEDRLSAPVLTFGTFEATEPGQPARARLNLPATDGDAGGPVIDTAGRLAGVLLPAEADAAASLPPGTAFAVPAAVLLPFLAANGIAPAATADATGALPPEDLAVAARGMTVLVSCWD